MDFRNYIAYSLLVIIALHSTAQAEETKGLLPEVKLSSGDEDKNEQKSYNSEVLITKAENSAIESLEKIIKKKKNTPEEADLLYRLAELHMRRAKSGRFFDLQSKEKTSKAKESLTTAAKIYEDIVIRYPKFRELDSVHFNAALAYLQINQQEKAKIHYSKVISDFPKSALVPDALLDLGEIFYNQQNFETALGHFKKVESYPKSKAYIYGVYKSAWCLYNMKDTEEGIKKLKSIVLMTPADTKDNKKYNLRKEALRDLTLFVGETVPPQELYSFFKDITTPDELGEIIINLASLYESHSRNKEISIFVKEFIDKNPENIFVSKAYVKLINTNETLKQRELVLTNLKQLASHCPIIKTTDSACFDNFRKVSLEISKKWWDIWLKNKNHTEFSKLTEQAFEILLANEDSQKPDPNSRYAYAELLFQQGKYELASQNYEKVSLDKSLDASKKHDALYGAIYSLDKLQEKNKSETYSLEQEKLAERYVAEFPNKEHVEALKFKLGFFAYQSKQNDKALSFLNPIAKSSKDKSLKTKSEDIILDIYNINKDYKSLISFAKQASSQAAEADRKQSLAKIGEEAHYSQLQVENEKLKADEKIDKLLQFSNEYKTSNLSKEALWQSISIAYANGLDIRGADLSLIYIEKYPADAKNKDALKEAVKAYTESGYLKQAIQGLQKLSVIEKEKSAQYTETVCDLQQVNNQVKESNVCYLQLIKQTASVEKRNKLIEKIVLGFDKNTLFTTQLNTVEGLENLILKDNIEPYATEVLISRAQELFNNKKYTEAFNLSLKVNSRPVDSNLRAKARLIQAAILEDEFIKQSVKSSEAKFALVLSIKTEKLDKAYTAYTSAIKMTKNTEIHENALKGIDRIYSHFIDSIAGMPVPNSLNEQEKSALKSELANMTEPFKAKRIENLDRLAEINKTIASVSQTKINWSTLPLDKTYEPSLQFPDVKLLGYFLPAELSLSTDKIGKLSGFEKSCDLKKFTASSIGGCIQSKNYSHAESLALKLTATKENRSVGLYYLSIIAEQMNQTLKSLWLIEKAMTLNPDNSFITYQKAKLIYKTDGLTAALPYFEKIDDLKKSTPEVAVISGLKSYTDKDYISTTEDFSLVSNEFIKNFSLAPLHIESFAQKGDYKGSISLAEKYLKIDANNPEINLQLARIYESYANSEVDSKKRSVENYQAALKKSKDTEQQNWIKNKLALLETAK